MTLDWTTGHVRATCPVCGLRGDQQLVATADADWQPGSTITIARCPSCRTIRLDPVRSPESCDEAGWEEYVEHTAGIEGIAAMLAAAGAPPGARLLDVGCGFGFGLDLSRYLWGWSGVGLDPGVAAQMGRDELGLDIRGGSFDDASAPTGPFDVVLASEVLEHLDDPRAFLRAVRARMPDDGAFVLTTPNAAVVDPITPAAQLMPALSLGLHRFLVDEDALRHLLEDAGFTAEIWTTTTTLHAVAVPTRARLRSVVSDPRVSLTPLAGYCTSRSANARRGSALAVGMALRSVKFLAYGPDLDQAIARYPALRDAILDRYDLDLDDAVSLHAVDRPPDVMAPACYFAGIMALREGDLDRCNSLLRTAAHTGRRHHDQHGTYVTPEIGSFEAQARGELALLAAQDDPGSLDDALAALDGAVERGACDRETAADYRRRARARRAGRHRNRLSRLLRH